MIDRFQGRAVVHHGVIKSLVVIFSLHVPAAGEVEVLWVMVVAGLFVGVNYVYFAIKRIREWC